MNQLAKRAVLMRLSIGLPGEHRQDNELTTEVKSQHNLGAKAGKWIKTLYPPEALEGVKKICGQAKTYHDAVTLVFSKGIGILPAVLIQPYGERMRQLKGNALNLYEAQFLAEPQKWIDWAQQNHNGTFESSLYPGCLPAEGGGYMVDEDEFRKQMREKFFIKTEPIPVPDSAHFENNVKSLLGMDPDFDPDMVNARVEDATKEAQRELFTRMITPIKHMVAVMSKEKPTIFDTMPGNISEIAKLVPALNLSDDPQLNAFAKEMLELADHFSADRLRKDKNIHDLAKVRAEALMHKLSGYKL